MDRKPNIIVTGMLDTKFNEIRFLADQVAVYGGNPVVMDLSLGSLLIGLTSPGKKY